MKFKLLFPAILLLFSGCIANYSIKYKYKKIAPTNNTKLSSFVFDIETFDDDRDDPNASVDFLINERMQRIDGRLYCVNSDYHYRKKTVPFQLTEVLSKHLMKKKVFKKVLINQKDSADFYITGKLIKFYGKQRISVKAIVGAQFGAIGALATMDTKSNSLFEIEMQELKLFNKKNELIKDYGNFKRTYEGEFKVDGHCWCAYENANKKLKDFYTDLTYAIEKDLSVAVSPPVN